jgi:hypothetical protein
MGQSLSGFLDHLVVDQVVIVQPGAAGRRWRWGLWPTRPACGSRSFGPCGTHAPVDGAGAHAPHPERMIPMNAAPYPEESSQCHIHLVGESLPCSALTSLK